MQIDYNALISQLPAILTACAAVLAALGTIVTAICGVVIAYYTYLGNHQRKEIIAQNVAQAESMQQIVNN